LTEQIKEVRKEIVTTEKTIHRTSKYAYWDNSILALLEIEKMHEAKAYLLIVQEIFKILNLSDTEKAENIYFFL